MSHENHETTANLAEKLHELRSTYSTRTKSGEEAPQKAGLVQRLFGKSGGKTHEDVLLLVDQSVNFALKSDPKKQYPQLAVIVKALQAYVEQTNSVRLKALVDDLANTEPTKTTIEHFIPENSDAFDEPIKMMSGAFLETKDPKKYPYKDSKDVQIFMDTDPRGRCNSAITDAGKAALQIGDTQANYFPADAKPASPTSQGSTGG